MTALHDNFCDHHVATYEPRPHLRVQHDGEGHPTVIVPSAWLGDLVEYLSFHRLNLRYHFDGLHFQVVFLCQTAAKVQQLLDAWAHLTSEDDQVAHVP